MDNLTSAVNVQVDLHDKELATSILKDLGLNMSTYINMAIKQLIKTDGIPFEVKNPKPSRELLKALKEGENILNDKNRKGYSTMEEFIKSLDED